MVNSVPSTSKVIKEYRLLCKGRYRKKTGRAILEGVHLLREALRAGIELDAVLYTSSFISSVRDEGFIKDLRSYPCYQLEDSTFNAIAQTENPQGIGAIARLSVSNAQLLWKKQDLFLLVLDRVQDPGNLGAILRTAAAAAVDGIILLPGTVDPTNPKALRASMGGIFYLPVAYGKELPHWLEALAERRISLVAADPKGETPYYKLDYNNSIALIIGNESKGVSKSILEKSDARVYIPLPGKIASLNAAVAAALFIFERLRQRNILDLNGQFCK